jgi:hypothetical protein
MDVTPFTSPEWGGVRAWRDHCRCWRERRARELRSGHSQGGLQGGIPPAAPHCTEVPRTRRGTATSTGTRRALPARTPQTGPPAPAQGSVLPRRRKRAFLRAPIQHSPDGLEGAHHPLKLVRQRRAHEAADVGKAGERGDVLKRDGGLAPGEDEGIGGPRPERRELEQQGLVPAHPIRRREDGPQDPELPPQALVPRPKLCDPTPPETRGARPALEFRPELGCKTRPGVAGQRRQGRGTGGVRAGEQEEGRPDEGVGAGDYFGGGFLDQRLHVAIGHGGGR